MVYVQYFQRGIKSNTLIEACGDRSVVVLDGRRNLASLVRDARDMNGFRRPYYEAFQIFKGESFTRSNPITEIIKY